MKNLVFSFLFLLSSSAFASKNLDEIRRIANAPTANMAETVLAFGKGLSKSSAQNGPLGKWIESAGRFQLNLLRESIPETFWYLSIIPAEKGVIVDLRFRDRSSIQILFINEARRETLMNLSSLGDPKDQLNQFFTHLGQIYVQQRAGSLVTFDI